MPAAEVFPAGTEAADAFVPALEAFNRCSCSSSAFCSINAFCCSFTDIIDRICSRAAESLGLIAYPTIGDTLLLPLLFFLSAESAEPGPLAVAADGGGIGCTSVMMGCDMPLMVTRRFLAGEGWAAVLRFGETEDGGLVAVKAGAAVS